MPRLQTQAPTEHVRPAVFNYHSEQRALEARVRRMMQSIAETTASIPSEPYDFAPQDSFPAPPFRWRDANWGFAGALVFSLLAWWAILTIAAPALHVVFGRVAT
jgi:anti-sigma factor RsiW